MEANIKARGLLTQEVADAFKARGTETATALIAEKTELGLSDLTPAGKQIVQVVSEYVALMHAQGKYPRRMLEQLRNRVLTGAAESSVCREKPRQGYQNLVDADLEDINHIPGRVLAQAFEV